MLGSPFPQPLSRSFLVFLLVWDPLFLSLYISSPSHCILFATHAHTIAACFAVVLRLCCLFLISRSQLITWKFVFYLNVTDLSDRFQLCWLKCRLIFFPYRPGLTSMQHTVSHTTAVQPSSQGWLHSRLVCVLDSGTAGPEFKSQPRHCQVTVLGKLF